MKKRVEKKEEQSLETTINSGSMILIILGIWAIFGATSILIARNSTKFQKKATSQVDAKMETKLLLEKVGALYDLPSGEMPTIATVSDKSKLQKQSFFAKAENGDKVLIYSLAKKAILYRPSLNKLIEVAPLTLSDNQAQAKASQANSTSTPVEKMITVSIYNGTKTAGIATATEKKLLGSFTNVQVVEKADAKGDYTKPVVIDISGNDEVTAKKIAQLLGATVSSLPKEEKLPKGDILVIMGE